MLRSRASPADSRGCLWFGTEDSGLDKFDPTTGTFTHYRNDSDGQFVGRISQVIADSHRDIWFVGERGLFHLNQQTGQITRPPATRNGLSAESVYEDEAGNLWMLADSPIAGLLKYDPQAERFTKYPLGARAVGVLASTENGGSANGNLVADGQNGLWVPSSQGLYYFDRRTERFTYRFQHDESNPDSLDSNAMMSVYQDRGGVLWVGTENAGLNILNFRQEQFTLYMHRPADPNSLSPGRVKAIYQESQWRSVGRIVSRAPWTRSIERRAKSPITFPSRATRNLSVKARTSTAFTEMQRVISGWAAGAAVLFGSMNALGVSSITGTTLMIPTA